MRAAAQLGTSFDGNDRKVVILLATCLLALVVAALFPSGGHFMVDEGAYHMMVRDFAGFRDFALWNGYEEFPSGELSFPVLRDHEGSLVSQYPEVYTLLALPFYRLMGYDGLFVLNALAFGGVAWLTFWLARRLFGSRGLALNACLVFVLATYAWEYSQATMPHAVSGLVVIGAVALALLALERPGEPRSLWLAAACGLVVGVGVGVRLDVAFVLPAVTVPFLFLRPWRPWHVLACALGTLPVLVLLGLVNQAKLGVISPFSYGTGQVGEVEGATPYLAVVVAGALALAAVRVATLPWGERQIREHRGLALLGLGLVVAAVLIVPQGRELAVRLADGLYQLLVDLRVRDLAILEGGLSRGPGGSMVYIGAVKKSLLQSCPYLVVLIVPLVHLLRRDANRLALALLFLVPASYIGALAYFAHHGGPGLNLRYLVPALPFLSILAAYAWRELVPDLPPAWRLRLILMGAILVAAFFFAIFPRAFPLGWQELLFLSLPLGLAGGLLVLVLLHMLGGPERRPALRGPLVAFFALSLTWSGVMAYGHDLPRSYALRKNRTDLTASVAPLIEPDSLLIAYSVGSFFGLLEEPRIRLATPPFDDFRDFEALVRFHLDAGRPVYLWVDRAWQEQVEARGLAGRLETRPLWKHQFGRLERLVALDGG
jgi:4-amino-4-deoxy-L-arabinose transferase-like glycosyltransferase